jgi:arabinogalactan oligomer/maltooligosaccharide transport system permease protein
MTVTDAERAERGTARTGRGPVVVVPLPTPGGPAEPIRPHRRGFGRWLAEAGWRHAVAVLALVVGLLPLWWLVTAAFGSGGLSAQRLLPTHWTLDPFRALITDPGHPDFWRWFANSMVIGVATAVATVAVASLAAFALATMRFRGRSVSRGAYLVGSVLPLSLAFVAIWVMLVAIRRVFPALGTGSIWGLVLVYSATTVGFATWVLERWFRRLPLDLSEAVRAAGASPASVFARVVLPLSKPVLLVVGGLTFVMTQAELLLAETLVGANGPRSQTLATGLSAYVLVDPEHRWGAFAAGALLASIPVVIVYAAVQRFLTPSLLPTGEGRRG